MPTEYQLREEFQAYMSRALSPTDNAERRDLISFVQSALYRRRATSINPEVVISEAYLAAAQSIQRRTDNPCQNDKPIGNIKGWYRGICCNVIAKMIKANIQQEDIALETAKSAIPATSLELEPALSNQVISALLEALESLSPKDKIIFLWRAVDELPWKNVSERVNTTFGEKTNATNIRKRGCRIKEALQAAFLANEDLDDEDKAQVCFFIQKPVQELWK